MAPQHARCPVSGDRATGEARSTAQTGGCTCHRFARVERARVCARESCVRVSCACVCAHLGFLRVCARTRGRLFVRFLHACSFPSRARRQVKLGVQLKLEDAHVIVLREWSVQGCVHASRAFVFLARMCARARVFRAVRAPGGACSCVVHASPFFFRQVRNEYARGVPHVPWTWATVPG